MREVHADGVRMRMYGQAASRICCRLGNASARNKALDERRSKPPWVAVGLRTRRRGDCDTPFAHIGHEGGSMAKYSRRQSRQQAVAGARALWVAVVSRLPSATCSPTYLFS
jgi:hypothetical protein